MEPRYEPLNPTEAASYLNRRLTAIQDHHRTSALVHLPAPLMGCGAFF